jgi:hypothetical protein
VKFYIGDVYEKLSCSLNFHLNWKTINQAVSRRLLTGVVRVRSQGNWCGIYGGQSDTLTGFIRVFRFHISILIPPTAPYSLIVVLSTLFGLNTDSR